MTRRGLTPQRITEAAADLADTVGLDHVTVAALARRFGVADASLYSHIRNIQDLRNRVAVAAAAELADAIALAAAGRSGRAALGAFGGAYREFALAHPGRYAASQIQLDPVVAAGSAGHRRSMEITHALLRGYGLAEPDATDAGRLLRAFFHGFASLEASGGFGHPRDTGASWDRALDALDIALRGWPSAGTSHD
jgi:AcrR family transcriptional regulator